MIFLFIGYHLWISSLEKELGLGHVDLEAQKGKKKLRESLCMERRKANQGWNLGNYLCLRGEDKMRNQWAGGWEKQRETCGKAGERGRAHTETLEKAARAALRLLGALGVASPEGWVCAKQWRVKGRVLRQVSRYDLGCRSGGARRQNASQDGVLGDPG